MIKPLQLWRKLSTVPNSYGLNNRGYAKMLRIIADQMEAEVVRDAGPPIGIYYLENPVEWLRKRADEASDS
jgi:hypothetical protein